MDTLQRIAHTLLYEGYVLWPYRLSAIKNQQRWTFGGVYPAAYTASSGGADRAAVRTECLLRVPSDVQSDGAGSVTVSVRFLQVVRRQLFQNVMTNGVVSEHSVHELVAGRSRYLSWDESTERTFDVTVNPCVPKIEVQRTVSIPAEEARESVMDGDTTVGTIVRSWKQLDATIAITVSELAPADEHALYRVSVSVSNDSAFAGTSRDDAIRRTLVSTHVALLATGGEWVSQFDPPLPFKQHGAANHNEGLWPILVGDETDKSVMLASPIILYDYPQLAPESPGDMFDGGEIDQLLILNVLTLTEDEQREMRDSDPRAREILERCQGLSEDDLMRLHGTVRTLEAQNNRYGVAL